MTAGADLRLLRAAVFTAVCVVLSAAGHVFAAGAPLPLWTLGAGFAAAFVVFVTLAGRERSLPGIAGALALGQIALHLVFSCGQHTVVPRDTGGTSGASEGLRALAGQLLCNDRAAAALTEAQAHRIVVGAGFGTGKASGAAHAGAAHATGSATGAVSGAHSAPDTPAECLRSAVNAALTLISGPMLLGHLLAALAAGWLLRRGEAALWGLVRLSAGAAQEAAQELVTVRALRSALALVRALHTKELPDVPARSRTEGARDHAAPRSVLLHHSVHRRGPPWAAHSRGSLALAA